MKLKRAPNSSQNSHSATASTSRPKEAPKKTSKVTPRYSQLRARRPGASASHNTNGVTAKIAAARSNHRPRAKTCSRVPTGSAASDCAASSTRVSMPTRTRPAPARTTGRRRRGKERLRKRTAEFLLRLDPCFLHDLRPFHRLRRDETPELLRAHLRGFPAFGLEALLRFGRGEDHRELLVQPLDHGARRAGGRDDSPPVGGFVTGNPRLRDRR